MSSEVDICNLALSHLGDEATVTSISPPEGSVQSEHCARFYPIARDTLLQMHAWNFAAKRVLLAPLTILNQPSTWKHTYAIPNDCSLAMSVMASDAADDYSSRFTGYENPFMPPLVAAGQYTPQPFSVELADTATATNVLVLYTNQATATLRYQAKITDAASFSPMFVVTLSWQLASMLAGPIIKGDLGAAEAKRCVQMMGGYLGVAKTADSVQRFTHIEQVVPWTSGR